MLAGLTATHMPFFEAWRQACNIACKQPCKPAYWRLLNCQIANGNVASFETIERTDRYRLPFTVIAIDVLMGTGAERSSPLPKLVRCQIDWKYTGVEGSVQRKLPGMKAEKCWEPGETDTGDEGRWLPVLKGEKSPIYLNILVPCAPVKN